MIALPNSPKLPIAALASSFDQVTNSYKFYWFLAILDHVREGKGRIIAIDSLLAYMISRSWYPLNFYRLSFGKQDMIGRVVTLIGERSGLDANSPQSRIIETAQQHLLDRDEVGRQIAQLANFVPYRFLRPFFAQPLRGLVDWKVNRSVRQLAEQVFDSSEPCLYRFIATPIPSIELHPDWYEYLQQHLTILTDFCSWHLLNYLQKNNPNIPNIAGKLFAPTQRDLGLAREFWNLVLSRKGQIFCIYSGEPLRRGSYSIDHFLPWRFVAHDSLWNLAPTTRSVNSAKSDCIPDLSYFDRFAQLQHEAVQIVSQTPKKERLLEDYILLFRISDLNELKNMPFPDFRDRLRKTIAPQIQIAANMGFSTGWKYPS
ncbi:MAG: HNH endonuclease domain-containing protein [Anaerolineales bacterium]|nr:HNH endonuclease [Anaerolineales bacterium]MDW8446182.1 HNH endonuclease domain-containing protein [Anaerolineales bacterium]